MQTMILELIGFVRRLHILCPFKKGKMKDISYRLGREIGLRIADNLPTLSSDMLTSYNVIEVGKEETKELNRLDSKWLKNKSKFKDSDEDPNWDSLMNYQNYLGRKYLPKQYKYMTAVLPSGIDLLEFKKGIGRSILNCDYSWYDSNSKEIKTKEINLSNKYRLLEITLNLRIDD